MRWNSVCVKTPSLLGAASKKKYLKSFNEILIIIDFLPIVLSSRLLIFPHFSFFFHFPLLNFSEIDLFLYSSSYGRKIHLKSIDTFFSVDIYILYLLEPLVNIMRMLHFLLKHKYLKYLGNVLRQRIFIFFIFHIFKGTFIR